MQAHRITTVLLLLHLSLAVSRPLAAQDSQQPPAEPAAAEAEETATSDQKPPEVKRPKFQVMRQNEDWSVLGNVPESDRTDFWDPIKYVPLNEDGSVWASFGGSTRFRLESWSNFNFGAAPPGVDTDDTFLLWRLLAHADLHVGENFRVFAEGITAQSTDRTLPGGRRPLDVNSLDLQQGFADLILPLGQDASVVLRAGRQELLFGAQRLVSPLPWANTMRSWDGASAIFDIGDWHVHGFYTDFVPVKKYEFDTPTDDLHFYGAYATLKPAESKTGLDLYWLGYDRWAATFNGTSGREKRQTVGGRLFGTIADTPLVYDLEGAYQFGDIGSDNIDAFMVASVLSYTVADWGGTPKFQAGVGYASGDQEAGGDVQTFNQLFSLGHKYLGYIDVIGRQNIIDAHLGVTFTPITKMSVGIFGHYFWRAEDADALYNAGGAVVRPGAPGTSRNVGTELDLTLKYKFDRHLTGLLGYSHFFPDTFIEQTGPSEDIDFLYLQFEYTF